MVPMDKIQSIIDFIWTNGHIVRLPRSRWTVEGQNLRPVVVSQRFARAAAAAGINFYDRLTFV